MTLCMVNSMRRTRCPLIVALLAAAQALDLSKATPGPRLAALLGTIREDVPRLREDRRMDVDQDAVTTAGPGIGAAVLHAFAQGTNDDGVGLADRAE